MSAPRPITARDVLAYSVTTPDLRGGWGMFLLHDGCVAETQSELKFMRGWSLWRVVSYCQIRRWLLEQVRVPI